MSYLDTLLIDGHDVRSLAYLRIRGAMTGLWAPGERRGDDTILPGGDGEEGAQLPLAKFIVHVPVRIMGATRGERNDNLRALGALVGGATNRGLVALERRVATGSGESYLSGTSPGRFITGLSMAIMNPFNGATELQYYNLKGGWFDGTAYTYP